MHPRWRARGRTISITVLADVSNGSSGAVLTDRDGQNGKRPVGGEWMCAEVGIDGMVDRPVKACKGWRGCP